MRAPAICDKCGAIFPSSFNFINASNVSFSGCVSGPCPSCGADGHIPDGVYNFIGNTIELLSGPSRTVSELQRLASILNDIKNRGGSTEQLNKKISDEIPELSSLSQILPKTRTELYAFIAIILTVITILIGQLKSKDSSKIEINHVVNNIYQQQIVTNNSNTFITTNQNNFNTTKKQKIGRNDPCPCGSGLKYKKCCLGKD